MGSDLLQEGDRLARTRVTGGFTWNSVLAILYAGFIIQPAALWLSLAANTSFASASFVVALFFAEIALLSGKSLTKQELMIIFMISSYAAGAEPIFLNMLYKLYFKTSPLTAAFGITELIPDWYAPSGLDMGTVRTFFDQRWVYPIAVVLLYRFITLIGDISITLFCRELFIKQEKLSFPLAHVTAETCITLGERDPKRMKIFSISILPALLYGLVLYGIPILTLALFGTSMQAIPIPWVDFNALLETYLPGSSFGIATDLIVLATGFVIPFEVAAYIFIGSFAIYTIANPIMLQNGIWIKWLPGMNVSESFTRSFLDVWISPVIGLTIAAALLPMIRHPDFLVKTFKGITRIRISARAPGEVQPWLYLVGFFASTISSVFLTHFLVPDLPLWIPIFLSIVWSFILAIVSSRARGITGIPINIPYVREALTLQSGYAGISGWLVEIPSPNAWNGGWTETLKVAELTETKVTDFIKAALLAASICYVTNFLYVSIFWNMAPIPSNSYPATQVFWPVNAAQQLLWVTRSPLIFRTTWILYGFLIPAVIYAVAEVIHLPFSLIGLASGVVTPIPTAVTTMAGAILGKLIIRFIGKEWWERNKTLLVAGFATGEGLVAAISVAIAMVIKSLWSLPL